MKVIEVIPNPYIALDKDGVPQGVVGAGMPGTFVGATIDLVQTRRTGKNRYFYPLSKEGKKSRRVQLTAEMATAIQAGELILVSREDAAHCGLSDKEFLEPEAALEAERLKALAYYQSARGKSAKIQDVPRADTKVEEGETPPLETATVQLTPTVKMKKEG